jgi:fumarylacetoacetate (FAA) hydrolase family protein
VPKTDPGLLAALPEDWPAGRFVGRMDFGDGPSPILVVDGQVFDFSRRAPTVSALLEPGDRVPADGRARGALSGTMALLCPIDLQCVKAAGVTFAVSALERVIEERARGDSSRAAAIRGDLELRIGTGLRTVKPGSAQAADLKALLIAEGMWSQYLEVAIGPDAEIFTKAPVLACVGHDADIGVRSDSSWNNPEPEIVLVVNSRGEAVGATLGNDVNLRDFEGRSALLLGKAKDNNASCAIGPLVRLFDDSFTLDDVRAAELTLHVQGPEGFQLTGRSSMSQISRDPLELARQALSEHQYPDGFVLFLGTLFAPTQDRDVPGRGFTHKQGDIVTISSPRLGSLRNRVVHSCDAPPWRLGIGALFENLAERGLLGRPTYGKSGRLAP